jgi:hypothetical protein
VLIEIEMVRGIRSLVMRALPILRSPERNELLPVLLMAHLTHGVLSRIAILNTIVEAISAKGEYLPGLIS